MILVDDRSVTRKHHSLQLVIRAGTVFRPVNRNARIVVDLLLEDAPVDALGEATVRLPPRGHRWIAVYTGAEPGQQVARSTGLTDRQAALELARKWDAEARQRRSQQQHRLGAVAFGAGPGVLTQAQVAAILGLSPRTVRAIERRAVSKLRRHPLVRQMWKEFGEAAPGRPTAWA